MKQTCRDIMTARVACCLPTDTVEQVAQLMKSEDIGPVPVIENRESLRLIGIVTDRDLVLKVIAERREAKNTRVEEIMTRDPVTCRPEDELEAAPDAMAQHQVRRIPVVENHNRLVGIIAQADVATRLGEPEETAELVKEISQETAPARRDDDSAR